MSVPTWVKNWDWRLTVAVLALLLAAFVFFDKKWIEPKALTIELVSTSSLLNENVRPAGTGLRVLFNNEPVQNFAIIRLRISNPGGSPITVADFTNQFRLSTTNVAKIYSAEVTNQNNIGPKPALSLPIDDITSIDIDNLVINQTDEFIIEAGVEVNKGTIPVIHTGVKITGIPKVKVLQSVEHKDNSYLGLLVPLGMILLVLLLAMKSFFQRKRREQELKETREETREAIRAWLEEATLLPKRAPKEK
jgi:hypothetical protein